MENINWKMLLGAMRYGLAAVVLVLLIAGICWCLWQIWYIVLPLVFVFATAISYGNKEMNEV